MRAGSHRGRVGARRAAVQAIYQWLIAGGHPENIVAEFVSDRELIKVDLDYFSELTRRVPQQHDALVAVISPALDREWSRVDTVERAVLLLGAFELVHCLHIPWRVAVNEAVELAKMFGAEDAHRYINGVLDKVAHETRKFEIDGNSPLSV